MHKIKFKFFENNFYIDEVERCIDIIPNIGDRILFNNRWYKVESREFDLSYGNGRCIGITCNN